MNHKNFVIDEALAHRLITVQFPEWKHLSVRPVALSGWDNRTFHLGEEMLVRLPSAAEYAFQVEKEHTWLPKLAPFLPLLIPEPIALGKPSDEYPWKWSIYRWIEGNSAASEPIKDLCECASDLAAFLIALQKIDATDGPLPGPHNFHRGGSLAMYSNETNRAIHALKNRIDEDAATAIWETALQTSWQHKPVWVHGDISAGNLVVQKGKLRAVIDFGQLAIGDPACDLAITWTFFKGESRKIFRKMLPLDPGTWARGRAWTLWKALITAAGFTNPNNAESAACWKIIEDLLKEHTSKYIL